MNQAEFDQACQFISTDVGRELELARLNSNGELGIPIPSGGGNLLTALGLLCYTEFAGKLRFGHKKSNGADASKRNFVGFFELLGPTYATFALKHDVYDVFRCGLAHEYYVKKTCKVAMLSHGVADGVGLDASGAYVFVVESYFAALKLQLDLLRVHLFPHYLKDTVNPINADFFYHDGRGPELHRVHWKHGGRVLVAADYSNHDDHGENGVRHVSFERVQVVQVTPEEVINYATLGPALAARRPAAMFDLGRSPWLASFSPRHLGQCHHFQLMFYDELFDVICESITCQVGPFLCEAG